MENRDGDARRQVDAESPTVMGLEHQAQRIRPCHRHCLGKHRLLNTDIGILGAIIWAEGLPRP